MKPTKLETRLWKVILLACWSIAIGCSSSTPAKSSGATGVDTTGAGSSGGSSSGGAAASSGGTMEPGGANSSGTVGPATGGTGSSGSATTGGSGSTGGANAGSTGSSGAASAGSSGAGGAGSGAPGSSSSGATGGSGAGGNGGGGQGGNRDGGPAVSGSSGGGGVGSDAGGSGTPVDTSKKITVWLSGDSTMMTCQGTCPCGWGSQFQPYFNSNVTVVDSAAGGRSIQTWLYDPNVSTTLGPNGECTISPMTYSARWQAMLDGMKAGDYLFIEFGINDGDPTCDRHVGTALFQTYLGTMAQAAKMRGAQPIFLTSTSMMACTGATVTPNRGFGPETKAAGTANNVPVIDLTALSAALYTTLALCPNDLNFASTTEPVGLFFCNDHTHFEAAGATKIAGVVAQALRDQNIGLAAYLK